MTNIFSWKDVVNVKEKSVHFVACHDFFHWRRHCAFENLENAITKGSNSSRRLLQSEHGNANHKNYKERGPASHVVLWYADKPWAILMNKSEITLVSKADIQAIENEHLTSAKLVRARLDQLFEGSPVELRHPLNTTFYKNVIACNN
jgi:hypothetical protein